MYTEGMSAKILRFSDQQLLFLSVIELKHGLNQTRHICMYFDRFSPLLGSDDQLS